MRTRSQRYTSILSLAVCILAPSIVGREMSNAFLSDHLSSQSHRQMSHKMAAAPPTHPFKLLKQMAIINQSLKVATESLLWTSMRKSKQTKDDVAAMFLNDDEVTKENVDKLRDIHTPVPKLPNDHAPRKKRMTRQRLCGEEIVSFLINFCPLIRPNRRKRDSETIISQGVLRIGGRVRAVGASDVCCKYMCSWDQLIQFC